jgi:uncharacterized alkaline shock family protein YloU
LTGAHTGPERRPGLSGNPDPTPAPQRRLPAPEQRGRISIAARVVERIAAQAVDEVSSTGGAAPRLLGVPLGSDGGRRSAQASAEIDGDIAVVTVRMSVTYPAPIRRTADAARDRVTARVAELTRLQVKHVDIDIAKLTPPTTHPRVH